MINGVVVIVVVVVQVICRGWIVIVVIDCEGLLIHLSDVNFEVLFVVLQVRGNFKAHGRYNEELHFLQESIT